MASILAPRGDTGSKRKVAAAAYFFVSRAGCAIIGDSDLRTVR